MQLCDSRLCAFLQMGRRQFMQHCTQFTSRGVSSIVSTMRRLCVVSVSTIPIAIYSSACLRSDRIYCYNTTALCSSHTSYTMSTPRRSNQLSSNVRQNRARPRAWPWARRLQCRRTWVWPTKWSTQLWFTGSRWHDHGLWKYGMRVVETIFTRECSDA